MTPLACPAEFGIPVTVDFSQSSTGPLSHGDYVTMLPNDILVNVSSSSGGFVDLGPRIYDTNIDNGADPDLEIDRGNVLIVQSATDTNPNDHAGTANFLFYFQRLVFVRSLVILDAEKSVRVVGKTGGQDGLQVYNKLANVTKDGETGDVIVETEMDFLRTRYRSSGALVQVDICISKCVNDSNGTDYGCIAYAPICADAMGDEVGPGRPGERCVPP